MHQKALLNKKGKNYKKPGNMKLKIILSIILFSLTTIIKAQIRTCGMVECMQEEMKNPEYAKQYKKAQSKFKAQLKENLANDYSSRMMSPIIIPIAVHFPSGLESDRTCLEALAQYQVNIINQDFSGTNTDISNWTEAVAQFYPETNTGAANFLFRIATMNHPTGVDPEMVEGGPAVTIGYNFGNGSFIDSTWAGYMNLVIRDINDLGASPFPGTIAAGHAVTINLNAFGSGAGCPNSGVVPEAPYDLGRTATHELGHFFNLDHTFTDSCDSDDNITDTPNQNLATFGCPALGSKPACVFGRQALFQSYMDYTNDACMFMFSAGQIQVAEAYVMSIQDQFKLNVTASISITFTADYITYQITSLSPLEVRVTDYDNTAGGSTVNIPPTVDYGPNNFTVTAIGQDAFRDKNLTSVIFESPSNVTSIGIRAFQNNQLTSVEIPSNLTSIGTGAFWNNKLTNVEIPHSVTNIGVWAFGDNNLTNLEIPNSVTSIGNDAFQNNQLTSVTFNMPGSLTNIQEGIFKNNKLTNIEIPSSVTSIGNSAFSNNQLGSITLPENVTNIGAWAFYDNPIRTVMAQATAPPDIKSNTFSNRHEIDVMVPQGTPPDSIKGDYEALWNTTGTDFKSIREKGAEKDDFFVYPNPARDKVYINLAAGQELKQVNIYTIAGAYLYTENGLEINTTHLSKGMYLFETLTKTGDRAIKKIVITDR